MSSVLKRTFPTLQQRGYFAFIRIYRHFPANEDEHGIGQMPILLFWPK